jgi:CheY-like chemotaxis protein
MTAKRILIVDDDSVTRDVLSRLLNGVGYQILTAIDGSQAVSMARHEKPDLILLDIIFPPDVAHGGGISWDGFLIIDWLRRQEEAKNIPIFMMTMADPAQYQNRALAKGAAAFFHKPIDHEALLAAIQKTIGEAAPPETGDTGDTVHVKLSSDGTPG